MSNWMSWIFNKFFSEKSMAWTAIFTGILVIFSYLLYQVANQANETNRETQRAYLNFSGIVPGVKVLSDDHKKWTRQQVNMTWANSGATPATDVIWSINNQLFEHELPQTFTFPELDPVNNSRMVLGPKGAGGVSGAVKYISTEDLGAVQRMKSRLYFWGWVAYKDVFKDDPDRLTEFCVEMIQISAISPDMTDPNNQIGWVTVPCKEHNCYDQGCSDYANRIDSVHRL